MTLPFALILPPSFLQRIGPMFPFSLGRRWVSFPISGVVLTLFAASCFAQDAPKASAKPVVLVPPFENLAKQHDYILYDVPDGTSPNRPRRQYRVDRYTEAPRALFEDALVNM